MYASLLKPHEVQAASLLRLQPAQYFAIKRRLLHADAVLEPAGHVLRRSEAQKLCRVDVNKVGYLLIWFRKLGWVRSLPSDAQQSKKKKEGEGLHDLTLRRGERRLGVVIDEAEAVHKMQTRRRKNASEEEEQAKADESPSEMTSTPAAVAAF
jgi:hypothetical protein